MVLPREEQLWGDQTPQGPQRAGRVGKQSDDVSGLGRPACWGRVISGPRGSQALLLGGATEGSHQVGQHTKATGVSTAPEVLWDLHFHSN